MRPAELRPRALAPHADGRNVSQIGRQLKVPRTTVRDWIKPRYVRRCAVADPCQACGHERHALELLPTDPYNYVLGMYLGDGYLAKASKGTFRLRIILDLRYRPIGSVGTPLRRPEALLRGLIHSDGCCSLNTVRSGRGDRTYAYARYTFSNRSEDLREIYCAHLDLLDIEWRRMNRWNISVARRDSVAKLDAFVGPKR